MMRGSFDEGSGEFDGLWQALCDRVYPMRDEFGGCDARRRFHQDVPYLTGIDLELDKLRARFRVCLEQDYPDRMWLLERIGRIDDELALRAEDAWPPRETEETPAPSRPEAEDDPPRSPRPAAADRRDGPVTMAEAIRAALVRIEREAAGLADGAGSAMEDAR